MTILANIFDLVLPYGEKVLYFLQVLIFFGILIAVHEFGHFISAKLTGMKVEEFAIGFGKKLFGFRKGETEYSLRIVPLGGYCKIFGMEENFDNLPEEEKQQIDPSDVKRAFNNRPLYSRFFVIIAGSLMNIVLAILLIAILGSAVGFNYVRVDSVRENSPADFAGIQAGDKVRLFAYNSRSDNIVDVVTKSSPVKGVLLRVVRDGKTHPVRVFPEMATEDGKSVPRIGVVFDIQDNTSLEISRILLDSPYSRAGLQSGDKIIAVNNVPVETGLDLVMKLHEAKENKAEIKVLRDNKEFIFMLKDFLIFRSGLIAETVKKADGYELVVSDVVLETPAHYAGLRPGMRISKIDGNPITENFNWVEFESKATQDIFMIDVSGPGPDTPPVTIPLSRIMNYPGISFKTNYIKVPFGQSVYEAVLQAKAFSVIIFDVLGKLFTKQAQVRELTGPIGIFVMGYTAASYGFIELIVLFSIISVNLGIVNMLPFPALDGGRAVFLVCELVFRKPILKSRIENIIHNVGFIILMALFLYVAVFDFGRIINMFK
jgi:regulator of sigma E protease